MYAQINKSLSFTTTEIWLDIGLAKWDFRS